MIRMLWARTAIAFPSEVVMPDHISSPEATWPLRPRTSCQARKAIAHIARFSQAAKLRSSRRMAFLCKTMFHVSGLMRSLCGADRFEWEVPLDFLHTIFLDDVPAGGCIPISWHFRCLTEDSRTSSTPLSSVHGIAIDPLQPPINYTIVARPTRPFAMHKHRHVINKSNMQQLRAVFFPKPHLRNPDKIKACMGLAMSRSPGSGYQSRATIGSRVARPSF